MTAFNCYLAGKITKDCWRHNIVKNLRGSFGTDDVDWPVIENACGENFDYIGPYFIGCDHGCMHGENSHGQGLQEFDGSVCQDTPIHTPQRVVQNCLDAIKETDLFFAWIDDLTCYGTIAEIGYAVAKGKKVFLGCPGELNKDLWFIKTMAHRTISAATPRDAFNQAKIMFMAEI